jgi:hypothetical protein
MTPIQLVEAVAACTGLSKETVVQHDRNLVVAGLRTKGGRGSSAAKVTHQDGARLLTAALGALRVKDSTETVRDHEATALDLVRCEHSLADAPIPAVANLSPDHNFVEALTAIVAAIDHQEISADFVKMGEIYVTVSYPWTAAEITFYTEDPEYGDGKVICRLGYRPSVSRKQIPFRSSQDENLVSGNPSAPASWSLDAEAYRQWWDVESKARERANFWQPMFDVICIEQKRRIKRDSLSLLATAFRRDGQWLGAST